ncbi:hypothetical protein EST38_g4104 [Candolleomyces aberdarensis]|uniref:Uncharacterized protein n=1 Tax=Candolleomyces aberdarensis TaxID=2316362 RepID=A0A4V1Q4E0_9AGAR|nr:hypothetical protein EST38_g4104 [Candolleomyces aberdarensis]
MPPPSTDDVSWETPNAKAQIAAMQEGSAGLLAKLHNHHIIGNNPDFPSMHIIERTIGNNKYCWELTPLRLQIWANALARSEAGVTLDTPPNSAHFDISKALKKVKLAGPPVPDAVPNPPPGYPYPFPLFGGYPYPFFPGPVPPMPYRGNPYAMLAPQMPGTIPASQYPVSPTPGRDLPKLSLEAFCTRYEVSDATFEKLRTLEYEPGDSGVEKMPQTEWEKIGFTWLGWHQFLKMHRLFVKEGKA